MRRRAVLPIVIAAFALAAAPPPVHAQAAFKVPFTFESGGKKFPAGDYLVTRTGDGQVTFQQVSTGKESVLLYGQKLAPAEPPAAEPRLVFDEVGNFEPSYTEYFTVYVLAEAWLSGQDGYLIRPSHSGRQRRGHQPGRVCRCCPDQACQGLCHPDRLVHLRNHCRRWEGGHIAY